MTRSDGSENAKFLSKIDNFAVSRPKFAGFCSLCAGLPAPRCYSVVERKKEGFLAFFSVFRRPVFLNRRAGLETRTFHSKISRFTNSTSFFTKICLVSRGFSSVSAAPLLTRRTRVLLVFCSCATATFEGSIVTQPNLT